MDQSKNLKIAHVTTVHRRNDIRIFRKQCKYLSSANFGEIYLIVSDGCGCEQRNEIKIIDIGNTKFGRAGRFVFGSLKMLINIGRIAPHIIHFHDPELIAIGIFFKITGKKVVYDIHENLPNQILNKSWIPLFLRKPLSYLMSFIEKFADRIFDGVITATPQIASRFSRKNTVVVQNFPLLEECSDQSKKLPQKNREIAFGYIGGISYARGIKEIIRSISSENIIPSPRLEIAGVFRPAKIKNEISKMEGWSKVVFHGWLSRSDVTKLLNRVRAGLLLFHPIPNHINAQPNKMFEYMAAGIPVIASNFPLWTEIIKKENCGIAIDPLDESSISDALRWILENPDKAELMGQNGRRAILSKYNWKIESNTLYDFYRKLTTNN